jgi:hypothetical protein
MTKMRRVLAAFIVAATIALLLAATQGTAWAATIDPRDGTTIVDDRATTPAPPVLPPTIGGLLTAFGVTWED